jgi:predicted enzyme related to lactoylglutathione lyase
MSTRKKINASNIVWFEIPADDVARAKKFYSSLFGWKISPFPNAAVSDYEHIATGGPDAAPDGGLMKRMYRGQPITSYISVPAVTRFMAKVEKLGGRVCKPKTAVPGMGYFAVCEDSEGNTFAIWEVNPKAK